MLISDNVTFQAVPRGKQVVKGISEANYNIYMYIYNKAYGACSPLGVQMLGVRCLFCIRSGNMELPRLMVQESFTSAHEAMSYKAPAMLR